MDLIFPGTIPSNKGNLFSLYCALKCNVEINFSHRFGATVVQRLPTSQLVALALALLIRLLCHSNCTLRTT